MAHEPETPTTGCITVVAACITLICLFAVVLATWPA